MSLNCHITFNFDDWIFLFIIAAGENEEDSDSDTDTEDKGKHSIYSNFGLKASIIFHDLLCVLQL